MDETFQLNDVLDILKESGAGENSVLYQFLVNDAQQGDLTQGDIIKSLIDISNTARDTNELHDVPLTSEGTALSIHEVLLNLGIPTNLNIDTQIKYPEDLSSTDIEFTSTIELSNADNRFLLGLSQMHDMDVDTYLALPKPSTIINEDNIINTDALINIGAGEDSALFKLVEKINNEGWDAALNTEISDIYNTSKMEGAFRFLGLDEILNTQVNELFKEANKATIDDLITPSEMLDFLSKKSHVIISISGTEPSTENVIEAVQSTFNHELSDDTALGLSYMHLLTEDEFKNPQKFGDTPKGEFNRKADKASPDPNTNEQPRFDNYQPQPGDIEVKVEPIEGNMTDQIASLPGLGKTA